MTANQKYKLSKSSLPFKEWLKSEQEGGLLEVRETFNASGGANTRFGDKNSLIFLGVGLLIGVGIGHYLIKKK